MNEDSTRNAYLRLAMVPDVGPITLNRLLAAFGNDPRRVLAAGTSELLRVENVGPQRAEAIRKADQVPLEETLELCERHGITILTPEDSVYPESLRQIPDPPPVLFLRGELRPEDALAIAMVGTRHPSSYGCQMARRLAEGFANSGLTVVSGLARGIDGESHEGAIQGGGRTIAVLGSGLLEIYPPEHKGLAERIVEHGAILSEMPPKTKPLSNAFPRRNRIVSGLSLGVIVVEAGDRSGTMITARHAAEQGRELFAVPGRLTDPTARGTLRLLQDGAAMVLSVDSVLEQLGPLIDPVTKVRPIAAPNRRRSKEKSNATPQRRPRSLLPEESDEMRTDDTTTAESNDTQLESTKEKITIRRPAELLLNDVEQRVLQAIGNGDAVLIDTVIGQLGLTAQQVLTALTILEMRHLIRRRGPMVARA